MIHHPALTAADQHHLADFHRLLDLIHARTTGVALSYHTGVYLTGRPGTSKTWTVERALEDSGVPYIIKNARLSPMGLWKTLKNHPEHVVVLDDLGSLIQEKGDLPILLAALGGHAGQPRTVTYTTLDQDHSFDFLGGVIAISNLPLRRDPLTDALASRTQTYEHSPSDEMIQAFMRQEALRGYKNLDVLECWEVVQFIVGECRESDYRLDLRYLRRGWEDRRLVKDGESRCAWQDLIRSSLKQIYASQMEGAPSTRAEKVTWKASVAADLFAQFPDRAARDREWERITGESPSSLYRHHQRAKALGYE